MLTVIATLGIVASALLVFGRPGDVSVVDECMASTIKTYITPQHESPPPPDAISDVNIGKLCNQDAQKRMHEVFVLTPVSLVLLGVGTRGLRRPRR